MPKCKNDKIRQVMAVEYDAMNTIRERQVKWYGHMSRRNEERIAFDV